LHLDNCNQQEVKTEQFGERPEALAFLLPPLKPAVKVNFFEATNLSTMTSFVAV